MGLQVHPRDKQLTELRTHKLIGTMNSAELRKYWLFRKCGMTPEEAKRAALILERFEWLEYHGKVRMFAVHEDEDYIFATYGRSGPDGYVGANGKRVSKKAARAELEDLIYRLGNWCVVSQIWNEPTETWEWVECIGMCVGYQNPLSPFENWYVPDLMQAAILEAESREWAMDKAEADEETDEETEDTKHPQC